MTPHLTDSEQRIVWALRELTDGAGYPPSIREIADAVALSASTVACHLQVLEREGIVTHTPYRSRSYFVRHGAVWRRGVTSMVEQCS
ncbi:LexA family protein [Streptomyces kronopolitis]